MLQVDPAAPGGGADQGLKDQKVCLVKLAGRVLQAERWAPQGTVAGALTPLWAEGPGL